MNTPQDPEAADTVQTTNVPAVALPRLVRQSYFGTVRITIGCMDRMCQVTYYNENREKQDIRGTSKEIADHINSLPNETSPSVGATDKAMTICNICLAPIAQNEKTCMECLAKEKSLCPSSDATACSACGQVPRRKVDFGDFSEYEARCLVAEYCMSVTLGCTGWGVDFKTWVELRGIAKHDRLFRLIRLPNAGSDAPGVIEKP